MDPHALVYVCVASELMCSLMITAIAFLVDTICTTFAVAPSSRTEHLVWLVGGGGGDGGDGGDGGGGGGGILGATRFSFVASLGGRG